MAKPQLSAHYAGRAPSAIRQAQILFAQRPDRERLRVVNVAIGNVTRPMHPAMQERLRNVGSPGSPFAYGVVKYTESVGLDETRRAFLNIIASGGFATKGLAALVTDGGSAAMELMLLGVCGPRSERPLLLIDPAYTNYMDFARRLGVPTVSLRRDLVPSGRFAQPDLEALQKIVELHNPAAIVIIPCDNPTGQFLPQATIDAVARLCAARNLWLVSDEAYRELHYGGGRASSVWGVREEDVPGITGRRISIESTSKVWNACGLRIGALVTDNAELHAKAVAEYTANLCANAIGQWIFGALAEVPSTELARWYDEQRRYYRAMVEELAAGLVRALPGIVVSETEAALYAVIDVRAVTPSGFDATQFIAWCARDGRVAIDGVDHTLLVAPMTGFYGTRRPEDATQMRIAFVEPPEEMRKVPALLAALLAAYAASK
jgi:aspartate aminotransferase